MNRTCLFATLTAVSCLGLAGSADAQYAVYGGGATFPSAAYRNLFDCFGVPITSPLGSSVATACGSSAGNIVALGMQQLLYAPVGSGGGKRAFVNHDGSTSASTGLGTPSGSNTVPYTSALFPAYGYPSFHFAGSDDILVQSDIDTYNTNSGPSKYGAIIQIPAVVGAVAIVINGNDGGGNSLNTKNAVPAGGTSGLNLSRKSLCGIFSGHITKWDNKYLTADNGGTPLGTGQITVIHRSEGSGTTFLFSQALKAQCAGIVGDNNESDTTPALYELAWGDHLAPTTQCPGAIPVQGSNQLNWPDTASQCTGVTIPTPAGSAWANASGSGGLANAVVGQKGSIGYVSIDFVQPYKATGPKAANIQNQYDLDTGATVFEPPTPAGAQTAMAAAHPSFTMTSVKYPLAWSHQGLVPNPSTQGAYPISGFSWLNFYQCYAYDGLSARSDVVQNYIYFHYLRSEAAAILALNGFAVPSQEWINWIGLIAFDPVNGTPVGYGGDSHCPTIAAGQGA